MIGILITGHGEFASGIYHAMTMITGEHPNISYVQFKENMDLSEFQQLIEAEIEEHLSRYDGVVVCSDLKGGTPFNVSAMVGADNPKVKIIAGTNLPMLIEASLTASMCDDVTSLAGQLAKAGTDNIEFVDFSEELENINEEMDGI